MSNISQNQNIFWHPIYSDYGATLDGQIFSRKYSRLNKNCDIRLTRFQISKDGYASFNIYYNNIHKTKKVAHFILECCYVFTTLPIWSTKTSDGLTVNHINSNKTDNNIFNLKIETNRKNNQLKESIKIENKQSGLPLNVYLKNECKRTKPYFVQIKVNNKCIYFGCFSTIQEAEEVAIRERKLLFPNE